MRRQRGFLTLLAGATLAVASLAVSLRAQPRASSFRPAIPAGLDAYLPIPEENALTPGKVALGRALFADTRLSAAGTLSCATCHSPRRAFTDGRPLSVGVGGARGRRNTPTLINRAYGRLQFWDGRAANLEAQVLQPIENPIELGADVQSVVAFLKRDRRYQARFRAAFGREVDAGNLAHALASYVRTILAGNSPVDRFLAGDREALRPQGREGLRVFRGKANCTACHLGPNFTDDRFHNTGVAWRDGEWLDLGRAAVTGDPKHRGAFKTPTLREVARTRPYMHDGSLRTLEEVVEFYDRGANPGPNLDPELRPLHLTADEKQAVVAFLAALSGSVQHGVPGQSP